MFRKILFILVAQLSISTVIYAQNALHFDGTNDYAVTSSNTLLANSSFTIEFWCKRDTINEVDFVFGNGSSTLNNYLIIGFRSNNQFTLAFYANDLNTPVYTDLNWHHWACTFDATSKGRKIYRDGVLIVSDISSSNFLGNGIFEIGKRANSYAGVTLDEFRIWNVARTATEIQNNMNSEFCVIPSSLKAYYKFNQGTASGTNAGVTTLNDNSGNAYTGTLSGFSLTGSSSNWVTGQALTSGGFTGGTANISGCVPYNSLGNQVLTVSGTYPDTFTTISGCDSIYTINFTAMQPSFGTLTTIECDVFTGPSGTIYDSTGIYSDTITNAIGCDSIITLNLTINNSTSHSFTTSSCLSYTSPSGNIYTTTGTYLDTIPNGIGCDSILTINLTIFNGYYITLNEVGCDSYTSPSGKIWTNSGTYYDTIPTGTGCDSLFTINLTMNQSSTNTVTESACDEYISGNGNSYTTTGTYTEVISNTSGCDSVITLNITITNIDTTVNVNGNTLTALASGLSYRWLDCNDNYAPISGGNQQSYTPDESGNYAVKITDGSCIDTSSCVNVTNVGFNELNTKSSLLIYPNPAKNTLFFNNEGDDVAITILTISGKMVEVVKVQNGVQQFDISTFGTGLYLIKYSSNGKPFVEKLVIE